MSDDETDVVTLTQLARWLYETYGPAAPNYRGIWEMTASGRIPAYREHRGWRVRKSDIPTIAEHFGLTPRPVAPTPAPAPSKRTKPRAA
jgi:hypothetical protein